MNKSLSFIFLIILAASCTGYNSTRVKDKNKDNPAVYGDVDGPARQLQNKYDSDPNSLERAAKLREKMYGAVSKVG